MSAQHTPGPWKARPSPESGYWDWTVEGKRISVGIDTDNTEADARLIAAAPDLLARLEELLEYSDALRGSAVHKRCVDAIAAATGAHRLRREVQS